MTKYMMERNETRNIHIHLAFLNRTNSRTIDTAISPSTTKYP